MDPIFYFFEIVVLIFSIVIHEFSHGWVANYLGDPTAKYQGRLTLNPLPHIDPLGSILVPFLMFLSGTGIIFGWAKPVPYNPYNLKDQKYGPAMVATAGPLSNLVVAAFFGIIIRILIAQGITSGIILFLGFIVLINIVLGVFNLVPIPPLDGSKLLFSILPYSTRHLQEFLERNGMLLLLVFIFFGFQLIIPIIFGLFKLLVGSNMFGF